MKAYEIVTQKIIEKLEAGRIPWRCGWRKNPAVSHRTGKPYSFLNQMLLEQFGGGEWLTFNQVTEEGGKVKKGEKGSVVLFFKWKEEETDKTDSKGEPIIKRTPIPRYYYVFEVGQCEGIERKFPPTLIEHDSIKEGEEIISNYFKNNPEITFEERVQNQAYFEQASNKVIVPERGQFKTPEGFYATSFHEMVHSTGPILKRDMSGMFGSTSYAKEELIAEIGSSYLCDEIGIENLDNTAAYIQSWLKALKDDSTFIVSAASKAEKAVRYILEGDNATEVE